MTKVLLADDEAYIRELIRMYLQDEGFELVEKSNGQDALNYLENHTVDLAILDIMMPKLDGWTVCSHLRKLGDIPILLITAKGESTDRIKGFMLGADDYLVKPFDPMELVLRVVEWQKSSFNDKKVLSETKKYVHLGCIPNEIHVHSLL